MTPARPFSVTDPLPAGFVALQASAGTGKTHALSSLAARFVAERGVPAAGLCVVSFTEATTAELRSRVRSRIAEAHAHLERCLAGSHPAGPTTGSGSDDELLGILADVDQAGLDARRRHLAEALADFDAATITTIHGFCRRLLAAAGMTGGQLDITDGAVDVAEATTDLMIARFGDDPDCPIVFNRLEQAVRLRLAMPDAQMWRLPADVRAPSPNQRLHHDYCDRAADLVEAVCELVRQRRTTRRRRTFDDLLADARALLAGPDAANLVAALRQRTQVVLIDEFQDTDSVQWDIFRRAFVDHGAGPRPAVVLVGDPKQSIYRFRSAELSAYVAAAQAADDLATLPVNWRSDASLLAALDALFGGFEFGDPHATFQPVRAADGRARRGLVGAGAESLTLRWVAADEHGELSAGAARARIQRDVVATVRRLLDDSRAGGVTLLGDHGESPRLRASDIAILTRSNTEAATVAHQLGAAGIAAASASNESVVESEAAGQWRRLLVALEQPGSPGRARSAALSWFVGMAPAQLAALDDRSLDRLHDDLARWSAELAESGLPRLLRRLRAAGLHQRVLAGVGGDRHLTDLDHIAELLLTVSGSRPVTASALLGHLAALERGVVAPGTNARDRRDVIASDLLARRIDRDDDAVQVLTIHKAKGLEYAVVLCPFLWTSSNASGPPHAHLDGVRQIQTPWITGAPKGRWLDGLADGNRREHTGEGLRLLYVALTRARHRCYAWWPTITTGHARGGALGALLAHAAGGGGPPQMPAELDQVVARSGGTLAVEPVPARPAGSPPHTVLPPDVGAVELITAEAVPRERSPWRIWSFSVMSATAHPHGDLDRVEARPLAGGTDEPGTDRIDGAGSSESRRGALRALPGGTAFGTLVHEVLERVDFRSPDVAGELRAEIELRLHHRWPGADPGALAAGLADALGAPLGGPAGSMRLRDLAGTDRLDELQFDLPLGRHRADRIGAVLAAHLAADDPLRPWAERTAEHGWDIDVEGMLTGSIDLVLRHQVADGGHRYVVVDYKTNQLGRHSDYGPAELVAAMEQHHYPLQAALYLVALHRYLRWRVAGYRPEQHLGGAAYLFLRGMDPARSATEARGVLWWTPPTSAVEALDRLLARGRP